MINVNTNWTAARLANIQLADGFNSARRDITIS